MLVAGAGVEPTLLGLLRGGAVACRRRLGGGASRGRCVVRRRRAGVPHRAGVVRRVRGSGRRLRGCAPVGDDRARAARGAGGGAGVRGRRAQRRPSVRRGDPRRPADLDARVRRAVGSRRPRAARGRAAAQPGAGRRAAATRARRCRAVLHGRHRRGRVRLAGRAWRLAARVRPGGLPGDRARADQDRVSRPRGPHQPAAGRGRHAARVCAGAARSRSGAAAPAGADRCDGGCASRAHAGVRRGPRRRGLPRALPERRVSARRRTSR